MIALHKDKDDEKVEEERKIIDEEKSQQDEDEVADRLRELEEAEKEH